MKKPKSWLKYVKSFSPIKFQILPDIELPKVKREYTPRIKSDKPRQHLEKDLELRVIKWLRLQGGVCGRTKTMGRMVQGRYIADPYLFTGFPDVVCFLNGLWFLEIKSPSGVLSEEQQKFQKLCTSVGVNYMVVRKFEDIERIWKMLDNIPL